MFRLLLHRAAHNWKLLKELEKAAKVYWNAKDRLPPRVRWSAELSRIDGVCPILCLLACLYRTSSRFRSKNVSAIPYSLPVLYGVGPTHRFYHRAALARLVSLVPTFGIGPAARTDHCRVRPPLLLLHLTPLPMARRRSEIDGYDGIPDEVSRSDFPKDFVFGVATSAYQVISVKSP
ncbi:hypothetical protein BHE74_00017684 [Ensete ventricosum]|nr:hypothetical protein GW17_00009794 [Ensete ventricosum]RWW74371.1 hypothetical protein BHE74_00017684 [Ensete ventricosum]